MGIYREEGGDFLMARGDTVVEGGDIVFLVATPQQIKAAADFLTRS
jgi:Trk K+ transport system NAD-binding subunit